MVVLRMLHLGPQSKGNGYLYHRQALLLRRFRVKLSRLVNQRQRPLRDSRRCSRPQAMQQQPAQPAPQSPPSIRIHKATLSILVIKVIQNRITRQSQ